MIIFVLCTNQSKLFRTYMLVTVACFIFLSFISRESLVNSYNPFLNLSYKNKDIRKSLSSSSSAVATTTNTTATTTATGTTLPPPLPSSQSFNYITSGTIVIQDYNNKFVAGEFHFTYFKALFIEWNGIYLLCGNECFNQSIEDTLNNKDEDVVGTTSKVCEVVFIFILFVFYIDFKLWSSSLLP